MRRWCSLTLLFTLAACGGCRQSGKAVSREMEAALAKRVAAREAAALAEKKALAAKAVSASDLRRALQLTQESAESAAEARRLSGELRRDAEKVLVDSEERREVAGAAEAIDEQLAPVEDKLLAVRLEAGTTADAERVIEEEGQPRELCRATLQGVFKDAACTYLKLSIKDPGKEVGDEVLDQVGAHALKSCLPKQRVSVWFKRGQTFRAILNEIAAEPDNLKRLAEAARAYQCDMR